MQITLNSQSDTQQTFNVVLNQQDIQKIKQKTLRRLATSVNAAGFRKGKAPLAVIEKNIDDQTLQSEFLQDAINSSYLLVINEKKLRPASSPQVTLNKFVPYQMLEYTAVVEVVGELKLADYKKLKKEIPKTTLEKNAVSQLLERLQTQAAERKAVKRAAKLDDQVVIDFAGTDKDGKSIDGAEGKDYPLVLGSKTFIPGYEEELVGLKPGDQKTFDIIFPKDYGNKDLQNQKVTFSVTVKKVEEVVLPELNDDFASKVGPFNSLEELKADIKAQLTADKEQESRRQFEDDILLELTEKSSVAIPETLIDEQVEHLLQEQKRNMAYRGQTFADFLAQQNITEEDYKEKELKDIATKRLKAGLVLSEIANREGIAATEEEVSSYIDGLKKQYASDPRMQQELDNPDNRSDIVARIVSQKTISKLVEICTK